MQVSNMKCIDKKNTEKYQQVIENYTEKKKSRSKKNYRVVYFACPTNFGIRKEVERQSCWGHVGVALK